MTDSTMAILINLPEGGAALVPAQLKAGSRSTVEPLPDGAPIMSGSLEAGSELWSQLKAAGWKWVQDGGSFGPRYWHRVASGADVQ
jgi:hypothetical protein